MSGSLESGESGVDEVCFADASSYEIGVVEGLFPSEVSWRLDSLAGGAPATVSFWVKESTVEEIVAPPIDCDFDEDFCWWKRRGLNWSLGSSSTPSAGTGPVGGGSFAYVEASGRDPYSGPFVLEARSAGGWMSFWYHMNDRGARRLDPETDCYLVDDGVGELAVEVGGEAVWERSGSQGDEWLQAVVRVSPPGLVRFVGRVGACWASDIAIDRVRAVGFAPSVAPSVSKSPTAAPALSAWPTTVARRVTTFDELQAAVDAFAAEIFITSHFISLGAPIDLYHDTRIAGGAFVEDTRAVLDAAYAFRVFWTSKSLVLERVQIQRGYDTEGGGLWVDGGEVVLRDCVFVANYANYGGAVYANAGVLRATDTHFYSNVAFFRGGAIEVWKGSVFAARSCWLQYNYAYSTGGAAYVVDSSADISNSTFADNAAAEFAGSLGISESVVLSMHGVTMERNTAPYGGAVVTNVGTAVRATNSLFSRNVASSSSSSSLDDEDLLGGGALYLLEGSLWQLFECNISGNAAAGFGGGIASSSSEIETARTILANNSASFYGGGAYVSGGSWRATDRCETLYNVAGEGGGGFFANDLADVYWVDGAATANAAFVGGGGVDVFNASFQASECRWVDNGAFNGAGVLVSLGGSFKGERCAWEGNEASGAGGAVALRFETSDYVIATVGEDIVFATSSFECDACNLTGNSAWWGGALFAEGSSRVFVRESRILRNLATIRGSALAVSDNGIIQLYKNRIATNRDSFNQTIACVSFSTIYAARNYARIDQTFDVASSCSAFLYLANDDGAASPFLTPTSTGTVVARPYTFPCGPGTYSVDGLEHGSAFVDVNNRSIDQNDPTCDNDGARCPPSCSACGPGRYAQLDLDSYKRIGLFSCAECPVGRFLPFSEEEDHHPKDSVEDCVLCAPGKFADTVGSAACDFCPPGTYASLEGALFCTTAEPGKFVRDAGATEPVVCPAGSTSVGGASVCASCDPGRYQGDAGETACFVAPPGTFVNASGAREPASCPAGTVSLGAGAVECAPCPAGTFQQSAGSSSCEICPPPTTTSGVGAVSCDACDASFYYDSFRCPPTNVSAAARWPECCYECGDGHECNRPGIDLRHLPIKRGWWRATSSAAKAYECELDDSCVGSGFISEKNTTTTAGRSLCAAGHKGALCAACASGFAIDRARNRCRRCVAGGRDVFGLIVVALVFGSLVTWILKQLGFWRLGSYLVTALVDTQKLLGASKIEHAVAIVAEASADDRRRRREAVGRSFVVKFKIVASAWQIMNSVPVTLPQVRFPRTFDRALKITSVFNLDLVEFAALDCVVARTSYYQRLVLQTLAFPFVVAFLIVVVGAAYAARRRKWPREEVAYGSLVLTFVLLPQCSATAFQYFSCTKYDSGDGTTLKVMVVDPLIRCRGRRYRRWLSVVLSVVAVWPIGVPTLWFVVLWRARARINPEVEEESSKTPPHGEERRHQVAVREEEKLKLRGGDIRSLGFLIDEYWPKMYLFPLFDALRRIFLSGCLALFSPGSAAQIAVGLVGATASQMVYSYSRPFVSSDDNVVSEVAQLQVVILFLASLLVFVAKELESNESFFSSDAFAALLVAIYFAAFFVAVRAILVGAFGARALDSARTRLLDLCTKRKSSSSSQDGNREEEVASEEDDVVIFCDDDPRLALRQHRTTSEDGLWAVESPNGEKPPPPPPPPA
ncbi:hypothetical protein CTAYLR_009791 [Chrysophaeum taylorii]|uniref:MAM domain-containing protein n=1 Tax=Chrysophaeum taylorii TaxID=2483200 RepID=A0AAD7UNT7_9STRA|nr:hypothetical protein CTAYLR_009791 [Chrysophaeum taylorii]